MQTWRCSNKACNWNKASSLVRQLSGTMHLDLVKLQAEHGANTSYRKAANGLARTMGKRRINNHSRIRSVTNAVGNILGEHQLKGEGQVLESTTVSSKYAGRKDLELGGKTTSGNASVFSGNGATEISFDRSQHNIGDPANTTSSKLSDSAVQGLEGETSHDSADLFKGHDASGLAHAQLEGKDLNLPECNKKIATEELCAAVDGGHVHDANNPGKNFEVMMGKVFSPKNIVRLDKHHTKITKKHCAGSGKYDKQKTMKANLVKAAKKEGIDKEKTTLTALADGAKNCWNVIKALEPLCLLLVCILDWFHIGKYIKQVTTKLPNLAPQLNKIKCLLWYGHVEESLAEIKVLLNTVTDEDHLRIINNFYEYIFENKKHIVDYDERSNNGLPYTSHVAESTVEHLLNDRCKRKQKMQWSRDGIHNVIQIRVSQASGDWDSDWENVIKAKYQAAA